MNRLRLPGSGLLLPLPCLSLALLAVGLLLGLAGESALVLGFMLLLPLWLSLVALALFLQPRTAWRLLGTLHLAGLLALGGIR
ncbi:MAG: hypothetical protein H6Q00_3236 [Holophagaceae bacterium]|nr:hypothetical protein [Holophagaceae bacterium]